MRITLAYCISKLKTVVWRKPPKVTCTAKSYKSTSRQVKSSHEVWCKSTFKSFYKVKSQTHTQVTPRSTVYGTRRKRTVALRSPTISRLSTNQQTRTKRDTRFGKILCCKQSILLSWTWHTMTYIGTNLIHDFTAVTFSVKLAYFREKRPFPWNLWNYVKSVIFREF